MNVNINYAVDFEELPEEVKKLLVEARVTVENKILDAFESAENGFGDENYFRALTSTEEIRKQLFKVDVRLQDCQNMLVYYQKALLAKGYEEEPPPEQLDLNFEGSDITLDEAGNVSVDEKSE